jgi:hypothetical protein
MKNTKSNYLYAGQDVFENYKIKIEPDHVCRKCGIKLTDENWYASNKKTNSCICKKCDIKDSKEWRQNNGDKYKESQKIWRQNNRDKCDQLRREEYHRLINEVIDAYGGKCACCGETRKEFLSIDHKKGGGSEHRREMGFTGSQFYYWLRQNNYPEEFQVLCFNCNCGKGTYSVSPHNKEAFKEEFKAKLKESRYARYRWALRMNIIEGYGGKCELCGKDNPHFLTIDHIDGINTEEEKDLEVGEHFIEN